MSKNCIESSERTETYVTRDKNSGKIISYKFKIYKRDRDTFIGELTREEMEFLMHNYTNKGAGLTQKEIAREFPQFTFNQVKDIIRAFNITKADLPLSLHEREELDDDAQYEKVLRIKENALAKRVEASEIRNLQNNYNKLVLENYYLKKEISDLSGISSSIKVNDLRRLERKEDPTTLKTVCIWLSDMHVGAWVNAEESLYGMPYNEDVIYSRLEKIYNTIASIDNIGEIIICNLGDSLDGLDQQTTRRDHILPQNMSNNQQLETYVKCMTTFFLHLKNIPCSGIKYYCVGDSNHDGAFGRAANRILQVQLQHLGINATILDKFMDYFDVGPLSVILCHGKDSKDMKKPLPVVLNPLTEVKINQFIQTYQVPGKKILFVKGDTHTSAVTYGSNFIYKSVGAFIGTTKWSSANFGCTLPVCDYSIIDCDCNILDGQIDLR